MQHDLDAADRPTGVARGELGFINDGESVPSPLSGVGAWQDFSALTRAVDQLPPKCRYAFVMHRFYGCELNEVARLMGLPERMVRTYVERAMVYCRERLFEWSSRR